MVASGEHPITRILLETLGQAALDESQTLLDLGLGSLKLVELLDRLERETGLLLELLLGSRVPLTVGSLFRAFEQDRPRDADRAFCGARPGAT